MTEDKPAMLELDFIRTGRLFKDLDKATEQARRACEASSVRAHPVVMGRALSNLLRLEAQADGLAYCLQLTRVELRVWVESSFAYFRYLEAEDKKSKAVGP